MIIFFSQKYYNNNSNQIYWIEIDFSNSQISQMIQTFEITSRTEKKKKKHISIPWRFDN